MATRKSATQRQNRLNQDRPIQDRPKNDYPWLIDDEADTIEQHLDMKESGPLRGDEILHHHGIPPGDRDPSIGSEDEMLENYKIDMSETNREGAEMSGDDHSAGLQGGETELRNQATIDAGIPGDATDHEESEVDRIEARRQA